VLYHTGCDGKVTMLLEREDIVLVCENCGIVTMTDVYATEEAQ
jgi:hypothetical protein